jgi:hypothetical protein
VSLAEGLPQYVGSLAPHIVPSRALRFCSFFRIYLSEKQRKNIKLFSLTVFALFTACGKGDVSGCESGAEKRLNAAPKAAPAP